VGADLIVNAMYSTGIEDEDPLPIILKTAGYNSELCI
jgi:hypothetical protein